MERVKDMLKNFNTKNIAELKNQFLPILISPRVDDVPQPLLLSSITSLVLFTFGIATVFLYNFIEKNQTCSTVSLPIEDQFISSCVPLSTTEDFVTDEIINGTTVSITSNLYFNFVTPQNFKLSSFEINNYYEILEKIDFLFEQNSQASLEQIGQFIFDKNAVLNDNAFKFEYSTDIMTCNIILNDVVSTVISSNSNVILTCSGKDLTLKFETPIKSQNRLYQLKAAFRHIHSPSEDADNFSMALKKLTDATLASCCIDQDFPFYIGFGLFAGIFFAIEGYVTFLFAISLFKNKLGFQESTWISQKYSRLTNKLWLGKKVSLEKEQENNNAEKTTSVLMKEFWQRQLFNPRCRTIKCASFVSILTFITIVSSSFYISSYLSTVKEFRTCDFVLLQEANGECNLNREYVVETSFSTRLGDIPLRMLLQLKDIESLPKIGYAPSDEAYLNVIRGCYFLQTPSEMYEIDFCIDAIGNNYRVSRAITMDSFGFRIVNSRYEYPSHGNTNESANFELSLSQNTEITKFTLSYLFENDNYIFSARSDLDSSVAAFSALHSQQAFYTGDAIQYFLAELLEVPFLNLTTPIIECCTEPGIFEVLGVVLGYVALLEGPITLFVAFLVYAVSCGA